MVLSLGGGEGRARASAEDNGSPGHQRIAIPRPTAKVIRFSTPFVTLSLFMA